MWRVLSQAGLLARWKGKPSKKRTGFEQPLAAHQHWHIDVSYINVCGTFYYLCRILDGYSRFPVHWDLCESLKEPDSRDHCAAGPGIPASHAADHSAIFPFDCG